MNPRKDRPLAHKRQGLRGGGKLLYLMPLRPHPRSCFFKQTVFQRQISDAFLQGAGFTAQILDLIGGGGTSGIARQVAFAGFHELLGPSVLNQV